MLGLFSLVESPSCLTTKLDHGAKTKCPQMSEIFGDFMKNLVTKIYYLGDAFGPGFRCEPHHHVPLHSIPIALKSALNGR